MRVRWIIFLLIGILLQQCAKQTAPTGGPKDEKPPALRASYPQHEQVNFKGDRIELVFDEAIQLNNPREQIIITPSVGKNLEVTSGKNRVTIDLKTRLQENTTYNINFREAIQDVTEKNPANIKLAFSTGPYIDSLSINGKVFDASTEKISPNYVVALAEASDTFNIFKHAASWLTLTDKKGFFSLENLKPGTYFVYAFDDKSKNLVVDSKTEKYGFIGKPVTLQNNIDSLKIRTIKLDGSPVKLISARTAFAYFNIRFSKSLAAYSVKATDTTIQVYSSLEADLASIKLYNTIPDLDSLQIRVSATDSLNLKIDTLLYMKFPKKEATRDKLTAKHETPTLYENTGILSTRVDFSKPITIFQADSMYIAVDSLTRIPITANDFKWMDQRVLTISKKLETKTLFPLDTASVKIKQETGNSKPQKRISKPAPSIIFEKGAFISIEKDTAQKLASPLNMTKTESTAILDVKIETTENFIIQLINKSEKIIRESKNQKEVTFDNLAPETFLLRLIIDLNKNGKWDAANFATRTEPEPIIYYRNQKGSKEITLKANWHVGPLLITY